MNEYYLNFTNHREFGFYNECFLPSTQNDIQIEEIDPSTSTSLFIKLWKKVASMIKIIAHKIFYAVKEISEEISSKFKEKEDPLDTEAKKRYQDLLPFFKELKEKIKYLDNFIRSKPDLDSICRDYILKFNHKFTLLEKITIENYNENEPIHRAGKLSMKCIDLQHALNQRIRFIKRHQEIYDLFEKYLLEDLHHADPSSTKIKELIFSNENEND